MISPLLLLSQSFLPQQKKKVRKKSQNFLKNKLKPFIYVRRASVKFTPSNHPKEILFCLKFLLFLKK